MSTWVKSKKPIIEGIVPLNGMKLRTNSSTDVSKTNERIAISRLYEKKPSEALSTAILVN